MENTQQDEAWAEIKQPIDAREFMGKVVAYQTNVIFWGDDCNHWRQPQNPDVFFGYVKEDRALGYLRMFGVLTLEGDRMVNSINEHLLEGDGAFLRMREATHAEKDAVIDAIFPDLGSESKARLEPDLSEEKDRHTSDFSCALLSHVLDGDYRPKTSQPKRSLRQRVRNVLGKLNKQNVPA